MRIYTYATGDIPNVIEKWGEHIEEREKSPRWLGHGTRNWRAQYVIHMWAYESYDQRAQVRAKLGEKGVWPPPGGIAPLVQENKLLLPMSFSPLQ